MCYTLAVTDATQPWSLEFYTDRRGRSPARDYLQSLPSNEQAEAIRVLDLLQRYGIAIGLPHARPIGGMWELRPGPIAFSTLRTQGAVSSCCTAIANRARRRQHEKLRLPDAAGQIS